MPSSSSWPTLMGFRLLLPQHDTVTGCFSSHKGSKRSKLRRPMGHTGLFRPIFKKLLIFVTPCHHRLLLGYPTVKRGNESSRLVTIFMAKLQMCAKKCPFLSSPPGLTFFTAERKRGEKAKHMGMIFEQTFPCYTNRDLLKLARKVIIKKTWEQSKGSRMELPSFATSRLTHGMLLLQESGVQFHALRVVNKDYLFIPHSSIIILMCLCKHLFSFPLLMDFRDEESSAHLGVSFKWGRRVISL